VDFCLRNYAITALPSPAQQETLEGVEDFMKDLAEPVCAFLDVLDRVVPGRTPHAGSRWNDDYFHGTNCHGRFDRFTDDLFDLVVALRDVSNYMGLDIGSHVPADVWNATVEGRREAAEKRAKKEAKRAKKAAGKDEVES